MINTQELRIGNYLQSETGEYLPVEYVMKDVIGLRNNIGGVQKHQINPIFSYDIEKIKPIPLTEDILLKCGFVQIAYLKNIDENFFLTTDAMGFRLQVEKNHEDGYYICESLSLNHIKYLHQLQNLYFALTGTELEINL